ncbi:MAG: universal stress protein [Verrucomicrobiota bacterium]|nr:universal stress protein [Verrucomicrobiota bacterium]
MKKILLCTDGSAYSAVSCHYAAWLAELAGASITLLYITDIRQFDVPFVADFSGSLGIQPYQDLIGQMRGLERHKAATIESASRKTLEHVGFTGEVEFVHRTGLLVDVLEEMEKDADLLIIGKRGASADVAIRHLGSNLERVIRSSYKPCLVTSRAYHDISRMLLAYDGSASCRKAVDFLCAFTPLTECALHLVTVLTGGQSEQAGLDLVNTTESRLKDAGYSVESAVLYGHVDEAIADYVRTEEIGLLIMGAYGHSRIRNLVIGSTSTTLIRECKIPVLCVR